VGPVPPGSLQPFAGNQTSWGGNSSLIYTKTSTRLTLGANLGASVRRLGTVNTNEFLPGYTGTLTASGPWGRRTRWTANTSLSYGPAGAAGFLDPSSMDATVPSVPLSDYSLSNQSQLNFGSGGTLSRNISRRGSVSGTLNYSRSNAVSSVIAGPETDVTDTVTDDEPLVATSDEGWFQGWNAAGRYTHQQTRYLSLYGGYGLQQNSARSELQQGAAPTTARLHTIDLGVGYARPLSFSRRTRFSSQLGSSIVSDRVQAGRQWLATGNASLRHELGRTWIAQLAYTRDTRFVPTFVDPIVNSGVSTRLAGNVTRKSTLGLLANYSSGSIGIDTGNNGFVMRTASVSYRYAFLQRLAAYVEYFLFDFEFDEGVQLDDAVFAPSGRHGIRVGVSIGTGLMGNRRRGPAAIGEGAQ
jgi:hypothetical protein